MLLSDLGHPTAAQLAACFAVHERTAYRWLAADQAPRAVLLALFWASTWGRSHIEAHAMNEAQLARGLADALARENADLRRELARVLSAGDFGSANAPTLRAPHVRRA